MDWWTILRSINIAGCVLGLYLLAIAHFRNWDEWDDLPRHIWWSMAGWLLLGLVMTIAALAQGNAGGAITLLTTFVIGLNLRALYLFRKDVS